ARPIADKRSGRGPAPRGAPGTGRRSGCVRGRGTVVRELGAIAPRPGGLAEPGVEQRRGEPSPAAQSWGDPQATAGPVVTEVARRADRIGHEAAHGSL